MYGAIIGDIIGSRFEFDRGNKSKEFELFTKECDFTDDTVMTIAVAEALMDAGPDADEKTIKGLLIKSMKKWGKKYPHAGYGARFIRWVLTDDPKPYGSYGNGSGMRVSSVGWLYDSLERTREVARWTAEVTHNHPEGIKGAEATAAAIFMARTGSTMEQIAGYIEDEFEYDLSRTLDEIRPDYEHVEDCMHTMPEAYECFLESESYEDCIRNVMYIGGDTDTLGAIAGAIAEAYWGIPQEILDKAKNYLPKDIRDVALRFMNTVIEAEHDEKRFIATDSGLRFIPPKRINDRKWSTTGGAVVPVDNNKVEFASFYGRPEQKHSGFDAPVYGRVVQDDEELVRQPDGTVKLVKKTDKENKGPAVITYEEALAKAKAYKPDIDMCTEYEKGYVFACKADAMSIGGYDEEPVVILKETGKITDITSFLDDDPGDEIRTWDLTR